MATERPRFMMSVPDELFNQIEDFRFENRFQNHSDAINELLRVALNYLKEQANHIDKVIKKNKKEFENGDYKLYDSTKEMFEDILSEEDDNEI
jgi:metal-responsive CopG/Arc/MetJ family transcriptional regulator